MPDGSIPQAEVTSCGLNAGPLPGTGVYEARIACNLSSREGTFAYLRTREKDKKRIHPYFTQSGGDREKDGDQYIANMTDGSVAGFKYFAFSGQEKTIRVNVRGAAEGMILVTTEQRKNSAAEIPIRASEQFQACVGELSIDAGVHALFFRYVGKGALDFNAFEIR